MAVSSSPSAGSSWRLLVLCVNLAAVRGAIDTSSLVPLNVVIYGQLNVYIAHPSGLLDAGLPRTSPRTAPPPRGASAGQRAPPLPPVSVEDPSPPPAQAPRGSGLSSPPPRRRSPPPRRLLAPPLGNARHRELLAAEEPEPGAPSYAVAARLLESVNATHSLAVSVDLGEQGKYLVTGSWLQVPATFYLNPAVAAQLGLGPADPSSGSSASPPPPPLSPAEAEQVAAALAAVNNTAERRPLGDLAAQGLLRLLDGLSVAERRARPFNSQPAAWPATGLPSAVASGPVREVVRVEPKQETWGPELGRPLEVSALVFTFQGLGAGCGLAPLSMDAVRAALTGSAAASLRSAVQTCSHDTYRLLGEPPATGSSSSSSSSSNDAAAAVAAGSQVLGPVPLGSAGSGAAAPCSGRTAASGADYDLASGCGQPEAEALAEAALGWLQAARPDVAAALRAGAYKRVLLLAAPAACFAGSGSSSGGGGGDGGSSSRAQAFHGLVSAGCPRGGPCTSWLFVPPGSDAPDPAQLLHALGHNEGAPHAAGLLVDGSTELAAAADPTDPMGSAGPGMCFAAPNAYKLGWATPVPLPVLDPFTGAVGTGRGDLPLAELPAGVFTEFQLPAMALSRSSLLRLVVEQAGLPPGAGRPGGLGWQRALFLSYRVRQAAAAEGGDASGGGGYDSGLPEQYDMRVWLHEANETATGAPAAAGSHTLLRAMLQPAGAEVVEVVEVDPSDTAAAAPPPPPPWAVGATYRYLSSDPDATGGHLAIAVRRTDGQTATVALCRFTTEDEGATEVEQCYNGLDDDCDGLTDTEDPVCM
ncbi:hypothetical protein HYH02_011076 [Chlamydomonas schloesseri]|uniref:Peptidase M11 gametolysin domain-containing protein n=1 Tax=Chlamydomonas schloesseri TaxID=2026947 RepID=A0A835W552_9CHLO|nr:hypothetical protein HYH02_011076 [Chlamydomonas schloesseri]|eukprot:KAG2437698.1 hypothetical protein HYH02_011076 [Chlamydomonas schloesseri]